MSTVNLGFIHFVLFRLQQNFNCKERNISLAKLSKQAFRWRVLLLEDFCQSWKSNSINLFKSQFS